MKALPPPPPDPLRTPKLPMWVVFEIAAPPVGPSGHHNSARITLREVARVEAGSEASAIVSAVESAKDVAQTGRRVAFPLERLKGRTRRLVFGAVLED